MEPFLPSEVARLVYGYLDEAKCDEAAQSFLEHSPHLSECLAVNKEGKGFNTRPAGFSLTDILDEYCEIRSMVAERLQMLPKNSAEKLRQCGSLMGQLQYLIDVTQSGQTLLVSIMMPPQESSAQRNSSSVTSSVSARNRMRILGFSDGVKRSAIRSGKDTKQQCSKDAHDTDDRSASVSISMSQVEATPLENLPGISGIMDNRGIQTAQESGNTRTVSSSGQAADCEHIDRDDSCSRTSHEASPSKPSTSSSSQCKKCCDKGRTSKYQQQSPCMRTSFAVESQNSSPVEDGPSCFSSPKRKSMCNSKRKSSNPTPVKGIHIPVKSHTPSKVRRSYSDDNESSESVDFSALTQALLDNKELHKKIAENINRVIHKPGSGETLENVGSHLSSNVTVEPSSAETPVVVAGSSCDGMLQELNQTIKTIVDQTEQDPVFERFLDEIIGPLDEEMTPSPAEMQSEGDDAVPDLAVITKQTKNISTGSEGNSSTPNKKSTSLSSAAITDQQFQEQKHDKDSSGKLSSDVPLKQRLRSARQHKSDAAFGSNSVSPTAPSSKEKKKEGTSLEDQNAAAIQCIVDAKISSQKISEVSRSHETQKNDCTSMSISAMDTQTFITSSSIDSSSEKPGHPSSQLMNSSSVTVNSLQKETNQILDASDRNVNVESLDTAEIVNNAGEVILFDGNLTFMDSSASFSHSTESGSNFLSNPLPLTTQLTAPFVVTSQPSISTAGTSQVMAITIPGTTDAIQQAATLSGISLHSPPEEAVPHGVATERAGQVVSFAIPDSQDVNSAIHEQDLMSMSTVIMCGNDGLIPQFISLPHQDSLRDNFLLPASGGTRYVPIAPRDTPVTAATSVIKPHLMGAVLPQQTDVCQPIVMCPISTVSTSNMVDPKPGTSKQAEAFTSQRNKQLSSTNKKKGIRNRIGVRTRSQVSKSSRPPAMNITCADDSRGDVKVMCSNTEQHSADCGLSLPSIILESPPVKLSSTTAQEDGVTTSKEAGREKLLGALNLKEASESSLNSKPTSNEMDAEVKSKSKMEADGNKSIKSKSEFILQNVDKYPPSPQLMTLVNLSKNFANTGRSQSTYIPGTSNETTGKKCSENKLTQKSRETPQATTSQGRTDMNAKRMSLSTPRRQRHVRALDFTTPPKARTVPKLLHSKGPSPKTSEKLAKTLRSAMNSGVSKVRSTLFKSPQNESETVLSDASLLTTASALSSAHSDNCYSILPPIATRSPLPQLCGGWDNAAGVGQIICDDINVTREEARLDDTISSNLSVTETRDVTNLSDKHSEVTERSTSLLRNREAGNKVTPKLAEGSLMSDKNLPCVKKAWDSDLRVHVNVHGEGSELPTNDKKKTVKKKETKTTKSRRKSSQVTEKDARRLEERLNKNENMDSESKNKDRENANRVSENIPSSSDMPVKKSTHDSEETDLDSEAKNQKRDLNTEGTIRVKGKSYLPRKGVEPTSEVVEKLSVKSKTFIPLDTLNERKDVDVGVPDNNQGASDQVEAVKESDGMNQDTKIQRKENLALETADSNEIDFSKSSDSSAMETVSPSTSVGSVLNMACSSIIIQSPTKLKGAERRIVHRNLHMHQSPNVVDNETFVIHTDDTNSVVDASGTGCELKGCTVSGESATGDQYMPASQNQELVSSTSECCPSDSQKKDIQISQHYKSSSSKEPTFANVPDNPSLKKLRTQTQICDTVSRSDTQPKSFTASVLDTPRKTDDPGSTCWGSDFVFIPLTPRMMSPHPDDTPITKLANGNPCIDFSLIQTPSFPPTPNIAVTPQSCRTSPETPSSYVTRSTDCSSCSPYYKPSGKLDSNTSSKPLEQLLVEECSKVDNNTAVQTSGGCNKCHKEDAAENAMPDSGQCNQPLPVTDKSLDEATSLLPDHVTDIQAKAHVGKELVSGKAVEGPVDSLVGAPTKAPSPEKQKQVKEMAKKRGTRDHGNTAKSDHTNIATQRKVRSLSRTTNKGSAMENKPSKTYSSANRKARSVSRAANRSSDFEDESLRAQISASLSTKKKSRSISKTTEKSSDFIFKSSETHTSASVSMKKARTANKSNDLNDEPSETHSLALISTHGKARSISRAANKNCDLKDELSETQLNPCKGLDEKTADEIIQRHLEAARMKLFGYNSPSDDSDFESSNDFGQSEAETKTVPSDVWNNKMYTELTKVKQPVTVIQPSKFCSTYPDYSDSSSKTNTQQTVETQKQAEEVRPVSGVSLMKENSQHVPASTYEAEIRKMHTNENVNCGTSFCHSEIPRFEIFSECDQLIDGMKKSSVHFVSNDSVGAKSHSSHSVRNTTLNNELDEKKRRMISKLKGLDISSVPNSEVKEPEEESQKILTVKTVLNGLDPGAFMVNNRVCDDQDVNARKQFREKEDILAKTSPTTPTEVICGNGGETTPAKKSPHLSVEAIADRLTREKVAVQAHPTKQTPVRQSLTYEDSSSEDFPALHLSSDDDTQSECINLSQVESEMAKLHGVEEATADVSTVRSSLSTTQDVYKDLELTPNKFRDAQSELLHTGDIYENERQEQSNTSKCKEGEVTHTALHTVDGKTSKKKLSPTGRQESTNKKIRALLGDDVSPIKNLPEVREVYKDMKGGILHKLFTATNKHNSPIKNTLEIKLQNKKQKERSGISKAVEKVQENEVLLEKNKVSETNKMKTAKSCETSAIEVNEAVDSRATARMHSIGPSMEGVSSLDKSMIFEQRQVSDNEAYIGIVYADEGPKGNNLVFEDISNFSLAFELGEDLDGVVKTYKCTISEFQELFCASPKQCTRESNSLAGGQSDITRQSMSSNCKKYKNLDCVKSSKDSHKELFHKGRSANLYSREHRTRSRSPSLRRSTHFSHDRWRTSHVHRRSPSPVHRRWSLSHNCGRRSQSLDHRRSSSSSSLSPVTSTPKMTTFSPLTELYNDYLRDERKSVGFGSSYNKKGRDFSFRSNERLPFGQRGRGKMKYDRHIHSQRILVHSSSRESSRTSASQHGVYDCYSRMLDLVEEHGPSTEKRFTQEVRATETCSGRVVDDTALLARTLPAAEDMDKEPARADTQIKDVTEGRQKVQDTDEPLEEGELVDEDSIQASNKYKCNDKRVVWPQKYPSLVASDDELMTHALVGSVRAENSSENSSSVLKVGTRVNSITSFLLPEHSKSVEDKPSQETEKAQNIFQKEASFAGLSGGRALPPKKRKASSEELSVQVEKRIRTDGPQALLKKVDLDHLLDFVHGEKPG